MIKMFPWVYGCDGSLVALTVAGLKPTTFPLALEGDSDF